MARRNDLKSPSLTAEEKAWCKKLEKLLISTPDSLKCRVNTLSPSQIIAALHSPLITEEEEAEEEVAPAGPTKLTKRQKQLILMLDQGLSNREIAEKLDISEHTVKVHLWRMYQRLGVNSRTQALHFARRHGLLGI
jgi:DNA-binding NarL/FixJ family response regulator